MQCIAGLKDVLKKATFTGAEFLIDLDIRKFNQLSDIIEFYENNQVRTITKINVREFLKLLPDVQPRVD